MKKIRKGDQVIVNTGKDKGKRGTVLRMLPNDRVLVENVNVVKRHTKANPAKNVTGGIMEKEASIHISNVMLFDPKAGKGVRVGTRLTKDGKRERISRATGEPVGKQD